MEVDAAARLIELERAHGRQTAQRAIDRDCRAAGIASDDCEAAAGLMTERIYLEVRIRFRRADAHRPPRNVFEDLLHLIKSRASDVGAGRPVVLQQRRQVGRIDRRRSAPTRRELERHRPSKAAVQLREKLRARFDQQRIRRIARAFQRRKAIG